MKEDTNMADEAGKISYPRLEALGWDKDEPTKLIQKGLDVLDQTCEVSEEQIRRVVLASRAQAKKMAATAKKVAAK
jgi:hypothetical protein